MFESKATTYKFQGVVVTQCLPECFPDDHFSYKIKIGEARPIHVHIPIILIDRLEIQKGALVAFQKVVKIYPNFTDGINTVDPADATGTYDILALRAPTIILK